MQPLFRTWNASFRRRTPFRDPSKPSGFRPRVEPLEERCVPTLTPGDPLSAAPTLFSGTGTAGTGAAISSFESAIGGANVSTANGPQASGFRTINWDGVALNGTDFGGGANTVVISQGNTVGIPFDRFQSRGAFFGDVYGVSGNGFTTVNPSVAGLFPAFSPNNTFAMFNDNFIDMSFVVPSAATTTPVNAASRGFGVVFINVELPNTSSIQFFNGSTLLATAFAPVGGKGQASFVGGLFNSPLVTGVRLTLGTDVLFTFNGTTFAPGPNPDNPGAGHNLVVTDDFVYAEPVAIPNGATTTGFSPIVVGGPSGTAGAIATVNATAGAPFTGAVATFSDSTLGTVPANYIATINWGDGHFTNGTIAADGKGGFTVSGTNTYATPGKFAITVDVRDFAGNEVFINNTASVGNNIVEAFGVGPGGAPEVNVVLADGTKMDFFAFPASFSGGVSVAVGDVTGDGVNDVIVGAGPGGGPEVKVFDGAALVAGQIKMDADFFAYSSTFTGGVVVAVGRILNTAGPADDLVTGPGAGGSAQINIYKGGLANLGGSPTPFLSFFAFPMTFTGGVSLAVADIDHAKTNGKFNAELIVGAGPGGGPDVKIYSGAALASGQAMVLLEFFALPSGFTGGVFVSAGDLNGDGFADLLVGAGAGAGPQVSIFDGSKLSQGNTSALSSFFAYPSSFTGGARVAVEDDNADGIADFVLTGAGPGGLPQINKYNAKALFGGNSNPLTAFFADPSSFTGGVFVAGNVVF
jgi:hypothetical protein